MRRELFIIVSLFLLLPFFSSCKSLPDTSMPSEQLSYNELSFKLSSNAPAGDTDNYDSYQFTVYLEEGQELYVTFQAVGGNVLVSILTPAEETWGYSPGVTEGTDLGKLVKGRTTTAAEGSFGLTASQWGNYLITVKSAAPKGDIDVTVEYNIK